MTENGLLVIKNVPRLSPRLVQSPVFFFFHFFFTLNIFFWLALLFISQVLEHLKDTSPLLLGHVQMVL